ncbi:hypothetical protein [Rhodococcus sp. NPDC056516]|uniref:hypothetical protein n=1 Tax=Rhodococcus sp. NPDC056516 TaxID=3345847 RepID=UPI00366C443C
MTDSDAQHTDPIAVGSRITVIPTFESQSGDTKPQVGTVVEDHARNVIGSSDLGRDWAPVLRWAIALDDGRLVFAVEGGPRTRLKLSVSHHESLGYKCSNRWVSVRENAVHKSQ